MYATTGSNIFWELLLLALASIGWIPWFEPSPRRLEREAAGDRPLAEARVAVRAAQPQGQRPAYCKHRKAQSIGTPCAARNQHNAIRHYAAFGG